MKWNFVKWKEVMMKKMKNDLAVMKIQIEKQNLLKKPVGLNLKSEKMSMK